MARLIAVLKLKKRLNDVLVFAQHVVNSMTGNPFFPSPPPVLAKLRVDIAAAQRAQVAALSRTVGMHTKRNAKMVLVRRGLEQLRVYVQLLADAARPEDAAKIIVSAGLFVKGRVARAKQTLAARAGRTAGTVRLTTVFAGKTAVYYWQYSLDQETWTDLPKTLVAKTTTPPLVRGKTYFFRARALRRKGLDDWSTPIAFLVG
jgi:hypothetical protein